MSDAPDPDREAARAELRRDVKCMRDEGVARWGEIHLVPYHWPAVPKPEDTTPEQRSKHEEELRAAKAQRDHEILFASTNIRPKLPARAPAPESVVQRSRPPERDDGGRKTG